MACLIARLIMRNASNRPVISHRGSLRRLTVLDGHVPSTSVVRPRFYSDYTGPAPTEAGVGDFRSPQQLFSTEQSEAVDQTIPRETDVVIIGGGLVGLSTAYWMKRQNEAGYTITVVEKDPSYAQSSSALAVGGLRQQFSLPENIQMSLQTADFLRNLKDNLQILDLEYPDIHYTPQGYLLLAGEQDAKALELDNDTQISLGVNAELMYPEGLRRKFPWLNVNDIAVGSYGLQNEGWFDTRLLLAALKAKAASYGVKFIHGEAVGFATQTNITRPFGDQGAVQKRKSLRRVHMRSGLDPERIYPLQFAFCFNCAGAWSRDIARLAGIGTGDKALSFDLPIIPRRRFNYVLHCTSGPGLEMPLLADTSGLFLRREGLGGLYVCSASPSLEVEQMVGDSTEAMDDYFENSVRPRLIHRIPSFDNIELVNSWPSFYEYNYFDAAPIVGNHPYHRNFTMATGLCGHGALHAPAIGRALMENFIYDEYRTVDLSRFTFDRILDDEPITERLML